MNCLFPPDVRNVEYLTWLHTCSRSSQPTLSRQRKTFFLNQVTRLWVGLFGVFLDTNGFSENSYWTYVPSDLLRAEQNFGVPEKRKCFRQTSILNSEPLTYMESPADTVGERDSERRHSWIHGNQLSWNCAQTFLTVQLSLPSVGTLWGAIGWFSGDSCQDFCLQNGKLLCFDKKSPKLGTRGFGRELKHFFFAWRRILSWRRTRNQTVVKRLFPPNLVMHGSFGGA